MMKPDTIEKKESESHSPQPQKPTEMSDNHECNVNDNHFEAAAVAATTIEGQAQETNIILQSDTSQDLSYEHSEDDENKSMNSAFVSDDASSDHHLTDNNNGIDGEGHVYSAHVQQQLINEHAKEEEEEESKGHGGGGGPLTYSLNSQELQTVVEHTVPSINDDTTTEHDLEEESNDYNANIMNNTNIITPSTTNSTPSSTTAINNYTTTTRRHHRASIGSSNNGSSGTTYSTTYHSNPRGLSFLTSSSGTTSSSNNTIGGGSGGDDRGGGLAAFDCMLPTVETTEEEDGDNNNDIVDGIVGLDGLDKLNRLEGGELHHNHLDVDNHEKDHEENGRVDTIQVDRQDIQQMHQMERYELEEENDAQKEEEEEEQEEGQVEENQMEEQSYSHGEYHEIRNQIQNFSSNTRHVYAPSQDSFQPILDPRERRQQIQQQQQQQQQYSSSSPKNYHVPSISPITSQQSNDYPSSTSDYPNPPQYAMSTFSSNSPPYHANHNQYNNTNTNQQPPRTRFDSDDIYKAMSAAQAAANIDNGGPKFYESDNDDRTENASFIRRDVIANRNHLLSMDSSMGGSFILRGDRQERDQDQRNVSSAIAATTATATATATQSPPKGQLSSYTTGTPTTTTADIPDNAPSSSQVNTKIGNKNQKSNQDQETQEKNQTFKSQNSKTLVLPYHKRKLLAQQEQEPLSKNNNSSSRNRMNESVESKDEKGVSSHTGSSGRTNDNVGTPRTATTATATTTTNSSSTPTMGNSSNTASSNVRYHDNNEAAQQQQQQHQQKQNHYDSSSKKGLSTISSPLLPSSSTSSKQSYNNHLNEYSMNPNQQQHGNNHPQYSNHYSLPPKNVQYLNRGRSTSSDSNVSNVSSTDNEMLHHSQSSASPPPPPPHVSSSNLHHHHSLGGAGGGYDHPPLHPPLHPTKQSVPQTLKRSPRRRTKKKLVSTSNLLEEREGGGRMRIPSLPSSSMTPEPTPGGGAVPNHYGKYGLNPPPAYHIRAESTGSVSSLGSITGGASMIRGQALTDKLGQEIDSYMDHHPQQRQQQQQQQQLYHQQQHNSSQYKEESPPIYNEKNKGSNTSNEYNHHSNNNHHPAVENEPSRQRTGSDSGGFLSSILGSISGGMSTFSSATSVASIEDETAEFHEKNQKFLKRAENDRKKQQRTFQRELNSSLRSLSPKSLRSHRPGLASIDNDNWEEQDNDPRGGKKKNGEGGGDRSSNRRSNRNNKSSKSTTRNNSGGRKSRHSRQKSRGSIGDERGQRRDRSDRGDRGGNLNHYSSRNAGNKSGYGSMQSRSNTNMADDGYRGGRGEKHRNIRQSSSYHYSSDESNTSTCSDDSNDENYISSDFTGNDDISNSSQFRTTTSSDDNLSYDEEDPRRRNEHSSLLPPSGINTYEDDYGGGRQQHRRDISTPSRSSRSRRGSNRTPPGERENQSPKSKYKKRRHEDERRYRDKVYRWEENERKMKDKRRRKKDYRYYDDYSSDDSSSSNGEYSRDRVKKKAQKLLFREREKVIAEWRADFMEQTKIMREEEERNRWYNRFGRWVFGLGRATAIKFSGLCSDMEAFISNLPLTIGAIALAIVTLGVVWFKFAEEMMDTCYPVHFHSSQCSFPEFPGCFYCDTSRRLYKIAVNGHFACTFFAGATAMLFFAKVFFASRVVLDEMNSPTTSSPAGLICMTIVTVAAGRGIIGQILVTLAASLHFCLAIWFIYQAIAYNILPDPSWFPNTIGIGLSAVKTWLYYPLPGHFLMATSLSLYLVFFPISLVRVTLNKKISAPVAWIQVSAPSIALYALTIMAQPSFEEEHPDITRFQRVHRMLYLPCMHVLFATSLVGMTSSIQSFISRWSTFSKKTFSPAHAAFCFPFLAHVNAVQAYRGAIDTFSDIHPKSPIKIAIFIYWMTTLILGTITTIVITTRYFYMLPSWTRVDVADEIEPPPPNETLMSEVILAGEKLRQDFVSPAVLQANEAGALVRLPGREGKYVRTRRVTALGFEPIMNLIELNEERDALLDWVAKNPPRQRKRTLSVPGITYNLGHFGTNNSGVFSGTPAEINSAQRRTRAQTSDGQYGGFSSYHNRGYGL